MVTTVLVLVLALLVQHNECGLQISIQPNRTDVEDAKDVTIRCSLNLLQTKTDRVYSIMLRRGNTTVVVMLQDEVELSDREYTVDGTLSTSHPGSPYLQVTLSNVTCNDRGNYCCKMAIRRSHRNLVLGPVSSLLTVVGKPSPVFLSVTPRKSEYAVGETLVFVCSALTKLIIDYWSWKLSSAPNDVTKSCSYRETNCLYNCTGSVSHYISLEDIRFLNKCGYRGKFEEITLNVTTFSSGDSVETSLVPESSQDLSSDTSAAPTTTTQDYTTQEKLTSMYSTPRTTDAGDNELRSVVIYSLICMVCLIVLCIFVFISVSVRCRDKLSRLQQQRKDDEYRGHRYRTNELKRNQGPLGSHVSIELRNHPPESGYLTPMKDNRNPSMIEYLQNRHLDAENDLENVYEEVE